MVLASQLRLETPVYGGSGCVPGSVQSVLTSDRESIHFVTPGYRADAEEAEGVKTCMVVLPVEAAPNTRVAISAVRVKTSSLLPEEATGVFQAELFIAGLRTPAMNLKFEGPMNKGDITVLEPEEKDLVWSGCGQSVNLRLNSSLFVTEGSIQVESLRVRLITKPC